MKLRSIVLHSALALAIWLFGLLLYVAFFVGLEQPMWFFLDAVVVALCAGGVMWQWNSLEVRTVSRPQLLCILALSSVCVLALYALVPDGHMVGIDEREYLATLRAGTLRIDGDLPFNMRWLMPILAGPLNILPVNDANALAGINAGALVVSSVYLVLLLRRLGVRFALALLIPVFFLSSYLGEYAAVNRLVLDPFTYAFFVLIFHALIRREHARALAALLLVAGFNSEKVIYWVPVIGMVELFREQRPWPLRAIKQAMLRTVKVGGPYLLYLLLLLWLVRDSSAPENHSLVQHLHQMAPTWINSRITTVPELRFQTYWFPFGAFTVYSVLALYSCPRWLGCIVLLLLPIYAQTLFSTDTERMLSYTFIVYLPLGFVFLEGACQRFPLWMWTLWFTPVAGVWLVTTWLPHFAVMTRLQKLVLSATEIITLGGVIFFSLVVFRERDPARAAPQEQGTGAR